MAEGQAGRSMEIYCHQCDIFHRSENNIEICPSCSTGFFEVVQQQPPQESQTPRRTLSTARGQILIGSFSQLFRDSNRSFGRGGGLNDSSFDDLPRAKITQEQVDANSLCSICFDGFAVDIDVLKLECNHLFHIECIRQWLRLHSNCPVCRSNVGSGGANTAEQDIMFTSDDLMRVGARIFVEGLANLTNDVNGIPDIILGDILEIQTTED